MPEPLTDRTTQAKEDRIRRLYRRQLDGLSARALVYDHKEKEQISINTAWRDWAEVKKLVDEDWQADRENMLARLQHMRTKLFHQALKKGQLQTASQVLDFLQFPSGFFQNLQTSLRNVIRVQDDSVDIIGFAAVFPQRPAQNCGTQHVGVIITPQN